MDFWGATWKCASKAPADFYVKWKIDKLQGVSPWKLVGPLKMTGSARGVVFTQKGREKERWQTNGDGNTTTNVAHAVRQMLQSCQARILTAPATEQEACSTTICLRGSRVMP